MNKHEEHDIQCGIVEYLRLMGYFVFAVPSGVFLGNDRGKSIQRVLRLKKEGFISGVSDLILLHKSKAYFIEVKTAKGVKSPNQKDFEITINNLGFEYIIMRSIDDAIKFVSELKNGNR